VFDNVKAAIAKETVLAYPDFLKPFEIYTDASSMQLGAVITQDNRPIAFFRRKLSKMQQKYSVTEIELLAIVEALKEFKGMLWGQDIKVYTDHKNLTRHALGLTSDRVYRWWLLLEEYAPVIIYI
jgi:ribonuclease HI